MSQENKNIQPSSTPTQLSSSQENLPFWKASLVKALRGTIGLLETTADKLETEPLPSDEQKPGFLQKLQQVWIGILGKIRLILPAQFSAKLSDTALTGILGGLVVMIFLVTSNLFDSKPSQVATVPPDMETPPLVSNTKPESIVSEEETVSLPPQEEIITKQEQEIPTVIEQKTPSPQETASLPTEEETIIEEEQQTPAIIESKETLSQEQTITQEEQQTPAIIESKEALSLEEETTPLPPEEETPTQQQLETTPPPIPLTPEQTLIAAIQNQVAEISNRTFSGIIESIQANFLDSNLTIKISNDWYSLEKNQQDKLAAEILQRSQELDFSHLEIIDLQGKLIARNPVVGTEMIIFKRK